MKRILVISILFLSHISIGQISFYKTYAGSAFDEGQGITQLPDSSYAITGSSGAFSSTSGQAYLMLVDSLGNHLWTKSYGGEGSDWGRRVFHKPGEGFVIVGYTNSTINGDFNFYFIELDETGSLIEEKNFGTDGWERMWDARMLNDNGLIMVGETDGQNTEMKDMYVVRTDAAGDTVWTKKIATQNDDVAYAVEIINDTTVIIGGDTWENEDPRSTILNMHINGDINWQTFYGDTVETGIRDLKLFNNNIYAGGYIVPMNKTDRDFWILKTDENGVFVKDFFVELDGDDFLSSITVKSVSDLYISIISDSPDLGVYSNGTDAFVQKFHTDLYFNAFSQGFSGQNSDMIHQMINTNDFGAAFVGTCGDDRVIESLGSDIMIAKLGPNDESELNSDNGNDLVSLALYSKEEDFKVYPNPASEKILVSEKLNGKKFFIYNSFGAEVKSGYLDSTVDVECLDSGVYSMVVRCNESLTTLRFVKK